MSALHPMFRQQSVSGEGETFALVVHVNSEGAVVSQCWRSLREEELAFPHKVSATIGQFPEVRFQE